MQPLRDAFGLVAVLMAAGCAVSPYEQSFQCPLSSDFGRCTDVSGAYADALSARRSSYGADEAARARLSEGSHDAGPQQDSERVARHFAVAEPTAPIVTPPALLRTWILGYLDAEWSLYAGRHVFHLAGNSTLKAALDEVHPAPSEPERMVLPLPTDSR